MLALRVCWQSRGSQTKFVHVAPSFPNHLLRAQAQCGCGNCQFNQNPPVEHTSTSFPRSSCSTIARRFLEISGTQSMSLQMVNTLSHLEGQPATYINLSPQILLNVKPISNWKNKQCSSTSDTFLRCSISSNMTMYSG